MEPCFVNIHTHHHSEVADSIALLNLDLHETIPDQGYYSKGIHPWSFDDPTYDPADDLLLLERQLKEGRLFAIGEVGVDKMHKNSLEKQLRVFEEQVILSEKYRKPLILHVVKCDAEILAMHKKINPCQAWIYHGFNGTEQDIRQMMDKNIFLSVGESIFHEDRKIFKSLKYIALNHLFLETDMSEKSIMEIYDRAASLMNVPLSVLKDGIFANFARYCLKQEDGKLAR